MIGFGSRAVPLPAERLGTYLIFSATDRAIQVFQVEVANSVIMGRAAIRLVGVGRLGFPARLIEQTFAGVPDGRDTAHTLRLLAHMLDSG